MQAIFNIERVESYVTPGRGNNVANDENSTESLKPNLPFRYFNIFFTE